jgi:hypothetical protein
MSDTKFRKSFNVWHVDIFGYLRGPQADEYCFDWRTLNGGIGTPPARCLRSFGKRYKKVFKEGCIAEDWILASGLTKKESRDTQKRKLK